MYLFQENHYHHPLRATKSTIITPYSDLTSKPLPLPRPLSTANLITEDVYELYDGSTSTDLVAVAAATATKKRGPPPRPPVPYRESHTLDMSRGQPGRKCSSDLESSLELSLQEARISSVMKAVKSQPQIATHASDPAPRKKYNPFKSKAKRST